MPKKIYFVQTSLSCQSNKRAPYDAAAGLLELPGMLCVEVTKERYDLIASTLDDATMPHKDLVVSIPDSKATAVILSLHEPEPRSD